MQAAGALEARLREPVGERGEQRAGDARPGGQRAALDGDLLERALAADAARRASCRSAARARVARAAAASTSTMLAARSAVGPAARGASISPSPSRKPSGELLVVAGRPHRHRQRLAVDADLQRLLDGDGVLAAVVEDDEGVRAAVAHEGSGHTHRVSGRFRPAVV